MNIMPALRQQKILVTTGVVIIAIVFLGSWVASRQNKVTNPSGTPTGQVGAPADQAKQSVTLLLQEKSQQNGEITYVVKVAENPAVLQSIGLKFTVSEAAVTKTSQAFSVDTQLDNQGWMTAGNNEVKVEDGRSTVQIGFVNIKPEGVVVTEELVLGEFSLKPNSPNVPPQFALDQAVSTAFAKDGSLLTINLVLEPKSLE
jgi:hypothetical protein